MTSYHNTLIMQLSRGNERDNYCDQNKAIYYTVQCSCRNAHCSDIILAKITCSIRYCWLYTVLSVLATRSSLLANDIVILRLTRYTSRAPNIAD